MPKKTRTSEGQQTSKFGIHYPAPESEVDIAGDFKELADSVEKALNNLEVNGAPELSLKTYDDLSAIGGSA